MPTRGGSSSLKFGSSGGGGDLRRANYIVVDCIKRITSCGLHCVIGSCGFYRGIALLDCKMQLYRSIVYLSFKF